MRWIGLTGGIGTGKSTVAGLLRQKGYEVLDADVFAKKALSQGSEAFHKTIQAFGPGLLAANGEIDRAQLAAQVFSNPQKLLQLESFIHPVIQKEVAEEREKLKARGVQIAFYDVPLLFEKKMESLFDLIVLVTTSDDLQRTRIRHRNKWSDAEIEARIQAQMPLKDKENHSDLIIRNDGDLKHLERAVEQLIRDLK